MNHQSTVTLRRDNFESLGGYRHDALINGIHLRVKFQAQHLVADIPQTGRTVAIDAFPGSLDVCQQQHAISAVYIVVATIGAKILQFAVFYLVKTAFTHLLQQSRYRHALFGQLFCKPLWAEFVDQLEWAPFPGVTIFHGLVDRVNVVRDLRYQRGGIT